MHPTAQLQEYYNEKMEGMEQHLHQPHLEEGLSEGVKRDIAEYWYRMDNGNGQGFPLPLVKRKEKLSWNGI